MAGPICEEIVPRDVGITEGLLLHAGQHHADTCSCCLALVYELFGVEALRNALRTRRGLTPEYDDDHDE